MPAQVRYLRQVVFLGQYQAAVGAVGGGGHLAQELAQKHVDPQREDDAVRLPALGRQRQRRLADGHGLIGIAEQPQHPAHLCPAGDGRITAVR